MCAKNIDEIDSTASVVPSSSIDEVSMDYQDFSNQSIASGTATSKSSGLTDSDRQQITNLISGYNIMLGQYEKLKTDLVSICNNIDTGNLNLGSALKAFSQSYSINGEAADSGKLQGVIKDAGGTRTYLMTVVMPAIDLEINDLKKRIAELQAQL